MYRFVCRVLSLVFFLSLAGCAAMQPKSDEDIVRKRAQQHLDALLAEDFKKAYSFASPTYRGSVRLGRYRSKVLGAIHWTAGELSEVSCEEELCRVTTKITYRNPSVRTPINTIIKNRWILVDGKWWVYNK